jgi:hypothetical protein
MDVLARLAALSEQQLRDTARRDTATGVLAEWELARRLGLENPTRTAVVIDGEWALVAGPHALETVRLSAILRRRDGEYTVEHVGKAALVRKDDARRFTLGPLYVPDFMDAHGEWTDPDELQKAAWEWVRAGDRRIFDQHDRTTPIGEWVEIMTMPQPWTVMMKDAAGNDVGEVTYPEGTVFLGVVWSEEKWPEVQAGRYRGYSIGGFAEREMAPLPAEATRPGLEME